MYRPVTSARPTLKQLLIAIHYPLYVTFLAMIGTVLCIRFLSDYTWRESAVYGVTLIVAFWLGQGFVALLQRPRTSQ